MSFRGDYLLTSGTRGNPVLETGTAYAMLSWLNEAVDSDSDAFLDSLREASDWTNDSVIGLAAGCSAMAIYFDPIYYCNLKSKYWQRCFYEMIARRHVSLFQKLSLVFHIALDSIFDMEDASKKRLTLLVIKTIQGRSFIIDLSCWLWWVRIRRVYGSANRIFIMLKGERHPFSVHCPR